MVDVRHDWTERQLLREAVDLSRVTGIKPSELPSWDHMSSDPLGDLRAMREWLASEQYAEAVSRQRQEYLAFLAERLAELEEEARLLETPRTWAEGVAPTPEELAGWLRACTAEELLRFCTRALEAQERASRCLEARHDGDAQALRNVQRENARRYLELETERQAKEASHFEAFQLREKVASLETAVDVARTERDHFRRLADRKPWWHRAWEWVWPS